MSRDDHNPKAEAGDERLKENMRQLWSSGEFVVDLPDAYFKALDRHAASADLPGDVSRRLRRRVLGRHYASKLREAAGHLASRQLALGQLLSAVRREAGVNLRQASWALDVEPKALKALEMCRASLLDWPISKVADLIEGLRLSLVAALEAIQNHESLLPRRQASGTALPRAKEDREGVEFALQDLLSATEDEEPPAPELPGDFQRALRRELAQRDLDELL